MNIYTKTNENKQITAYATEAQDGYTRKTITTIDAASLAQYYSLMWAEDGEGGLVHAENLPLTDYQKDINKRKAELIDLNTQVDNKLQSIDDKIKTADNKLAELEKATTEATDQLSTLQETLMSMQQSGLEPQK